MQVVQQTEQAYWELVYAYNNLQVQLEAVDIGRQQDESNRRQQAQGLLAPIDVVAAQTQLASFELNAYSAQTALTQAENTSEDADAPDRELRPVGQRADSGDAADDAPPVSPLADAVNEALANRPETAPGRNLRRDQSEGHAIFIATRPSRKWTWWRSYTRAGLAGPRDRSDGRQSVHRQLRPADRPPESAVVGSRDSIR